jgi:hypothetical protein
MNVIFNIFLKNGKMINFPYPEFKGTLPRQNEFVLIDEIECQVYEVYHYINSGGIGINCKEL